ncbi:MULTISPECIES: MFS transporter [unclassified Pseudofrankia]|uniref:MFS transporter n=1 Tax=unclassified Pseudofrankia TaxID=2994372 RepID=UPI0008DA2919|nr:MULTISPECIES: MFS transporter [unclassified Pseudofrankia]MDT3440009.1 MFS transporter [Pseudofrankia sp. BMG5.37]OHV56754.1 MFS transporter [Pseudofrankia sp. BMG5.36]
MSSPVTSESGVDAVDAVGPSHERRRNPAVALAVIAVCQLMTILDATVVNIALPTIQKALDFSTTQLSWVLSGYTVTFGGLLLLGGRAGDILGRRRVFMTGIAVFTIASLVGGFATNPAWLLSTRALQGLGAALASPNALSLIATNFEAGEERNRAFGLFAAVSGAGSALGLILGGMLTSWASWRWVLFINVPIGVILLALAPRFVRESTPHPGRFDLAGAITSTTGMAALVYAFIRAASDGWRDQWTIGAFIVAGVTLTAYIFIELRASQPITPLQLFRERDRTACYLTMLLSAATLFGIYYFMVQFLQEVRGFSPIRAGLAFLPFTLILIVSAQAAASLVNKVGPRLLMIIGGVFVAGGMFYLAQVGPDSGYTPDVLVPLALMGLGSGIVFVPVTLVALNGVEAASGAASGLLDATQQVGSSLGLAVMVTAFGTAGRHVTPLPGASAAQQQVHVLGEAVGDALLVGACFAACAILVALLVFRGRGGQLDLDAAASRGIVD